jgi:hypothetical protein
MNSFNTQSKKIKIWLIFGWVLIFTAISQNVLLHEFQSSKTTQKFVESHSIHRGFFYQTWEDEFVFVEKTTNTSTTSSSSQTPTDKTYTSDEEDFSFFVTILIRLAYIIAPFVLISIIGSCVRNGLRKD